MVHSDTLEKRTDHAMKLDVVWLASFPNIRDAGGLLKPASKNLRDALTPGRGPPWAVASTQYETTYGPIDPWNHGWNGGKNFKG